MKLSFEGSACQYVNNTKSPWDRLYSSEAVPAILSPSCCNQERQELAPKIGPERCWSFIPAVTAPPDSWHRQHETLTGFFTPLRSPRGIRRWVAVAEACSKIVAVCFVPYIFCVLTKIPTVMRPGAVVFRQSSYAG